MCGHIEKCYKCKHAGIARWENCPQLGITCKGNNGQKTQEYVDEECYDCKIRRRDPNPGARANDPYRLEDKKYGVPVKR